MASAHPRPSFTRHKLLSFSRLVATALDSAASTPPRPPPRPPPSPPPPPPEGSRRLGQGPLRLAREQTKSAGIAAAGNTLYCVPSNASSVLVIDANTDTVRTIECGVAGKTKWAGVAAVGTKLYCTPSNASSVICHCRLW